jgi:hypothetical protein
MRWECSNYHWQAADDVTEIILLMKDSRRDPKKEATLLILIGQMR